MGDRGWEGSTFSVLAAAYFEELFDVLDLFRHFGLLEVRTRTNEIEMSRVCTFL